MFNMKNWLSFLLLGCYLLDPFKYGYIFGYLIVILVISNLSFIFQKIESLVISLIIFSVTYSIFYSFNPDLGSQYIFIYSIFPISFYSFGKYISLKEPKIFIKPIYLLILALLFSLTALISTTTVLFESGFIAVNRNINNFWTNAEENATYTAGFFILNMCIPAFMLIGWKKLAFWERILCVILFTLTLACVLRLGSRTQLLIAFLATLTAIIYIASKQSSKKNFLLILSVLIITNVGITYLSVKKDADYISAFTTRMESKKYGTNTAGGRTERWEKSLINLKEKPLGWKLDDFGYSHNLWLDVLRVGGIIPFSLLLIFTFLNFKMLINSLRATKSKHFFIGMLTTFIIAFNLLFIVEPIFEGYFEVFVLYCFVLGLLSSFKDRQNTILFNIENSTK